MVCVYECKKIGRCPDAGQNCRVQTDEFQGKEIRLDCDRNPSGIIFVLVA